MTGGDTARDDDITAYGPIDSAAFNAKRVESLLNSGTTTAARCAKHPAFEADNCPKCGTATTIRTDL